jgi:hypothetical protein
MLFGIALSPHSRFSEMMRRELRKTEQVPNCVQATSNVDGINREQRAMLKLRLARLFLMLARPAAKPQRVYD